MSRPTEHGLSHRQEREAENQAHTTSTQGKKAIYLRPTFFAVGGAILIVVALAIWMMLPVLQVPR
jgi:hypothetical protein